MHVRDRKLIDAKQHKCRWRRKKKKRKSNEEEEEEEDGDKQSRSFIRGRKGG